MLWAMRWWLGCVGWMLAPMLAVAAAASAEAAAGGDAQAPLPAVSAHPPVTPPAHADLAELLPPGARVPGIPSGWVTAVDEGAEGGAAAPGPFVERVERATASGDAIEPIEVAYTVDRELELRVRELLRRGGVELGSVLLMDAATGALLAYVSTDPVAFPVTRTYPTASLAKVVTAAAILRRRVSLFSSFQKSKKPRRRMCKPSADFRALNCCKARSSD
jgi:hypothetical protein